MQNQIKVELQDFMGDDRQIADAAWTSSLDYQKKQTRTDEDVRRVVNMLADAKHSTPFESVVLRFWIRMPIATDRQYMTHRLQSASGMSGRYRTMPSEYLAIPSDVNEIINKATIGRGLQFQYEYICRLANEHYKHIVNSMKEAEKNKIITNSEFKRAREFFRGILPQHNMTERVSIMNLRAFANFYKLRSKPDAQPEIRQVAELMLKAVKESNVAPIAIEALERNLWMI